MRWVFLGDGTYFGSVMPPNFYRRAHTQIYIYISYIPCLKLMVTFLNGWLDDFFRFLLGPGATWQVLFLRLNLWSWPRCVPCWFLLQHGTHCDVKLVRPEPPPPKNSTTHHPYYPTNIQPAWHQLNIHPTKPTTSTINTSVSGNPPIFRNRNQSFFMQLIRAWRKPPAESSSVSWSWNGGGGKLSW